MQRPRLLLVSATYIAPENLKKVAALAEHFEVVCVTGTQVEAMGVTLRPEPPRDASWKLVALRTVGDPLSTTKYLLRGLRAALRDHPADIVLVESEPWALVRWQTWWWKRIEQPAALF